MTAWNESPDYEEGMDDIALIAPAWMAHGPDGIGAWIMNNITGDPTHEDGLFSIALSTTPNSTTATHYAAIMPMSQEIWDQQVAMEAAFSVEGNTELYYIFIPNSAANFDEVRVLRGLHYLAE